MRKSGDTQKTKWYVINFLINSIKSYRPKKVSKNWWILRQFHLPVKVTHTDLSIRSCNNSNKLKNSIRSKNISSILSNSHRSYHTSCHSMNKSHSIIRQLSKTQMKWFQKNEHSFPPQINHYINNYPKAISFVKYSHKMNDRWSLIS